MELPKIDPASITHESVPQVLCVIMVYLEQINKDQIEIKAKLECHDKFLAPAKFSLCTLIPWIIRNKVVIFMIIVIASFYISTLQFITEWASRSIHWTIFPPKIGGP
jgi:hypothetical protein